MQRKPWGHAPEANSRPSRQRKALQSFLAGHVQDRIVGGLLVVQSLFQPD
jgi:hypothetical protein